MSVTNQEIVEFTGFAHRLADAARAQTLPLFRSGAAVFNKAGPWFDPVTDADREAERVLREMISKIYPGHGVIGEEFGEAPADGPWRWVLDPVDGTRAFISGAPSWAILIAIEYEGAPVLGVIDQPFMDERWLGAGGKTQYICNGEQRQCQTSSTTDLAKAKLTTTDPRGTEYFNAGEAAAFDRVAKQVRLTRFGFDAYGYALLALGELDLVVEAGLQHHDYAALVPVIEGAGGVITNWRGDALGSDERGEVLAAATPELHAAAMAVLEG